MRIGLAVLALLVVRTVSSIAQTHPAARDSSLTIITKIPFEGKNYFIRIVPVDSTNIDNMPLVGAAPSPSRVMFWNDSLQYLLPDSVLNEIRTWRLFPRPQPHK